MDHDNKSILFIIFLSSFDGYIIINQVLSVGVVFVYGMVFRFRLSPYRKTMTRDDTIGYTETDLRNPCQYLSFGFYVIIRKTKCRL